MTINALDKLAALLKQERDALLSRWRQQVRELPAARQLDIPTLNDHMPDVLDELATALRSHSDQTIPEALREGSPPAHGLQRLKDGFDIEEVVAEYNILRGCIHDLADDNGLPLQGKPFHIINRLLDQAGWQREGVTPSRGATINTNDSHVRYILAQEESKRTKDQNQRLLDYFLTYDAAPELRRVYAELNQLKAKLA